MSNTTNKMMSLKAIAAMIDHTLLKPSATADDVRTICDEATEHGFCAVCVAPARLAIAAKRLQNTTIKVAAVVGFPHGNTLTAAKAAETTLAIDAGAAEIDMVIHVGALIDGDHDAVHRDIAEVVRAAGDRAIVKVILETASLTDAHKAAACEIAEREGAHFVKTSTGFAGGGATAADVRLMRTCVGDRLGVKASGGIRTYDDAVAMIEAGASRLGCSASVAIVTAQPAEEGENNGY